MACIGCSKNIYSTKNSIVNGTSTCDKIVSIPVGKNTKKSKKKLVCKKYGHWFEKISVHGRQRDAFCHNNIKEKHEMLCRIANFCASETQHVDMTTDILVYCNVNDRGA